MLNVKVTLYGSPTVRTFGPFEKVEMLHGYLVGTLREGVEIRIGEHRVLYEGYCDSCSSETAGFFMDDGEHNTYYTHIEFEEVPSVR